MISRKELLSSKEFWLVRTQTLLYNYAEEYLKANNLSRTQFAEQLGVSKGYVTQVLQGDFDHRLSKFVELALSIGKVPVISFVDIEDYLEADRLEGIKLDEEKAKQKEKERKKEFAKDARKTKAYKPTAKIGQVQEEEEKYGEKS